MGLVVDAVLPLFALILAGYLCGWRGLLGSGATDTLNRFVVWLALPALLFQSIAEARWSDMDHPAFAFSIAAGMLVTFGLGMAAALVAARARAARPSALLPDATIDALASSYPNTGFMGIPLCLVVFGRDGLSPAVIATILTACLLFGVALALIEIGLHHGHGTGRALVKVAATLARNPLLVAPALGLLVAVTGVPRPAPLMRFSGLLGAAASPCALVTLGLFLAQGRRPAGAAPDGDRRAVAGVVALKLVVQPIVTGLLVFVVFAVPRPWSSAALLLSALPTGTGPFLLAKLYDRRAAVASRTILLSTLLSLLSISFLVAWIGRR